MADASARRFNARAGGLPHLRSVAGHCRRRSVSLNIKGGKPTP
jgi:hypothetical protein